MTSAVVITNIYCMGNALLNLQHQTSDPSAVRNNAFVKVASESHVHDHFLDLRKHSANFGKSNDPWWSANFHGNNMHTHNMAHIPSICTHSDMQRQHSSAHCLTSS